MCILLTESEPKSTHLFQFPCKVIGSDDSHTMLVYMNDMESTDNVMLVGIPRVKGKDIGLVSIDDAFRDDLDAIKRRCDDAIPYNMTEGTRNVTQNSYGASRGGMLQVHRVGNYDISVAHSLKDIHDRVDWTRFRKPADFDRRLRTLGNKELFPFSCSVIVAQSHTQIANDGFGVVYSVNERQVAYFPTCHEMNETDYHYYDVRLYVGSYNPDPIMVPFHTPDPSMVIMSPTDTRKHYYYKSQNGRWKSFAYPFKFSPLNLQCTWSETGLVSQLDNVEPFHVHMVPVNVHAKNQNVFFDLHSPVAGQCSVQ